MTTSPEDIELVHLDESVLVVEKPAGLLAVQGRGQDKHDCVATRVQARWPGALIVHRLDQATSGLMVFARDGEAQRSLGGAFERHEVRKRYIAVVHGCMSGSEGLIDLPLSPDWPNRPRQRVDTQNGKPSLTRWRLLATEAAVPRARLELEPVTGRTHQLRVHLQSIGHAIVGDRLYGTGDSGDDLRLLLHAAGLEFPHPVTGVPCRFESPAPF